MRDFPLEGGAEALLTKPIDFVMQFWWRGVFDYTAYGDTILRYAYRGRPIQRRQVSYRRPFR